MRVFLCLALLGVGSAAPGARAATAKPPLDGLWGGAIQIAGQELKMAVQFKTEGKELKATIDIPEQGAKELPLTKVSYTEPRVHFELPAGPGLAVWDGQRKDDVIEGEFKQGGLIGKFHLKRGQPAKRPAAAEEKLPYPYEEVTFKNGDVTLAGTLTLPVGDGPFPAVALITGSGPHDRDETLFDFKPFRIIADHLTRHGVAVLRWDDRGVGDSTGKKMASTTSDLADDAVAAVKFLQSRKEIDPKKIGLWGHSEGGIIAPLAASRSQDVAFLVLMSGTGVSGERIVTAQQELIARASGATEAQIAAGREMQKRVFAAVRTGKDWEDLKGDLLKVGQAQIEKLPAEQRKAISDPQAFLQNQVEGALVMAHTPWFRYFIDYDPAPALEKVRAPVLLLFGEKDLQVPVEMNRDAMVNALARGGNTDVTVKIFPKTNHLYQESATGNPTEYPTAKKEFVPGFLQYTTDWLTQRVQARNRAAGEPAPAQQ